MNLEEEEWTTLNNVSIDAQELGKKPSMTHGRSEFAIRFMPWAL